MSVHYYWTEFNNPQPDKTNECAFREIVLAVSFACSRNYCLALERIDGTDCGGGVAWNASVRED